MPTVRAAQLEAPAGPCIRDQSLAKIRLVAREGIGSLNSWSAPSLLRFLPRSVRRRQLDARLRLVLLLLCVGVVSPPSGSNGCSLLQQPPPSTRPVPSEIVICARLCFSVSWLPVDDLVLSSLRTNWGLSINAGSAAATWNLKNRIMLCSRVDDVV